MAHRDTEHISASMARLKNADGMLDTDPLSDNESPVPGSESAGGGGGGAGAIRGRAEVSVHKWTVRRK